MGSTRLPGKILKNLAGKPQLWHVVRRSMASKKANSVVVATTTNQEDDVIEKLCKEYVFLCYRGSSENVLERYYEAAKKYNADIIVRVTSDCPLIDPAIIDRCVDAFEKAGCDYINNTVLPPRTFPRGLDCEVFSFAALEKAYREATEDFEREHVTPYFWQNKNGEFKIGPTVLAAHEYEHNYRLTVDYHEDFEFIEKIYNTFYRNDEEIINVPDIFTWLGLHPEIVSINSDCEQKHRARIEQQLGKNLY